jgi:hypothetical protein
MWAASPTFRPLLRHRKCHTCPQSAVQVENIPRRAEGGARVFHGRFLGLAQQPVWDTIIACTGDYMAGAYADAPSQKPWESPHSWASTGQYLVVQVKE